MDRGEEEEKTILNKYFSLYLCNDSVEYLDTSEFRQSYSFGVFFLECWKHDLVFVDSDHSDISDDSAVISWIYTLRPQDIGFVVAWKSIEAENFVSHNLNGSEREYELTDLGKCVVLYTQINLDGINQGAFSKLRRSYRNSTFVL